MLKQVAFAVACAVVLTAEVQAGIFGFGQRSSGGCPNGQCSMRSSYQHVAQTAAPATQVADAPPAPAPEVPVATVTPPPAAPAVEVTTSETAAVAQPMVASGSSRGRMFRRWNR